MLRRLVSIGKNITLRIARVAPGALVFLVLGLLACFRVVAFTGRSRAGAAALLKSLGSKFRPAPQAGDFAGSRALERMLAGVMAMMTSVDRDGRQPMRTSNLAMRASDLFGKCAHILAEQGQIRLAVSFLRAAIIPWGAYSFQRQGYLRTLGIQLFMMGKMSEALPCFAEAARVNAILRSRPGVSERWRILGGSWFAAIGHVAMIDMVLKKQQLGWENPRTTFVTGVDYNALVGKTLLLEFEKLGLQTTWPAPVRECFAPAPGEAARAWDQLTEDERQALQVEFWEHDFPDGEALYFAFAAARIQNRWEAEGRAPLLCAGDEFRNALVMLRRQLGIPADAWFVCLHVRESGFHAKWNRIYRQARDADIQTYEEAIRAVTSRGGWVLRMGDPSMRPLKPMDQVVDYVHTPIRSEFTDVVLLSQCRFFIGTNSGLSIIPAVYGVPCVLTNWVPVGTPNWYGKDLMIPKLAVNQSSGKVLTLAEMLTTDVGYIQTIAHLPPGLGFIDNSPGELAEVVEQMLSELEHGDGPWRSRESENAYFAQVSKLGSYVGSRIGSGFIARHGAALGLAAADTRSDP